MAPIGNFTYADARKNTVAHGDHRVYAGADAVEDLCPDLLCLDITPEQWQRQDFADLPPEYREALVPLAYQTDIVIVPVGEAQPLAEPTATGWRGWAMARLRRLLGLLQRTTPDPAALNRGWRHDMANGLYDATAGLAGAEARQARHHHTHHLIERVAEVAQRDPGRRILVVVNVRYCHHIRPELEKHSGIHVIHHTRL